MDPSIRILTHVDPKNPVLIAAWPGMGNVAFGAAMYLKESLKAYKFADIRPEDIFYRTGVQIRDGILDIPELPRSEFYYFLNKYGKNDLLIFIGESQPVMEKEYELAKWVVEVAREYKVTEIITFAATPVNITHHAEPEVWCVSTDRDVLLKLPKFGMKIMTAGHIGGLNGLLLGVGKLYGIKGSCFLGEIPFYTAKIENPKSSLAILKVFMKYTGITIDSSGLIQMAKYVEEEIERVSKTTKQSLFGEESSKEAKVGEETGGEAGPGEEKVVTREVRDMIEYMFEAASKDISKASELKAELDKWGLFQEYEDRFLDLFGKNYL